MFKLDSGEKIILEVRKHWFVIFAQGFTLFIVALIPLILLVVFVKIFPHIQDIKIGGNPLYLFSFFYFIWLLAIWVSFFVQWTDYYLDVWLITPKRIIAVNQKGLFNREVIDLLHERVQDTTSDIKGLIPTLLHFGDIQVQTAGEKRPILFKQARNPIETKKVILEQYSKF